MRGEYDYSHMFIKFKYLLKMIIKCVVRMLCVFVLLFQEIAAACDISAMPTFLVYKDGNVVSLVYVIVISRTQENPQI